jgi:hypothetical protein
MRCHRHIKPQTSSGAYFATSFTTCFTTSFTLLLALPQRKAEMRAEAAALLAAHQAADEQRRMLLIDALVSDRGDGAKVLALLTLLALPVQKELSLLALAEGGAMPLASAH